MPDFTVEATYRMPYYRQRTYDAATSEEACRLAIEDDDWESELPDYECPGPTYITGIWKGTDAAYDGEEIAVPSHFQKIARRMVDQCHELLDQLAYVAQPQGLSRADFERWLPKATAVVEKARAIVGERRDPVVVPIRQMTREQRPSCAERRASLPCATLWATAASIAPHVEEVSHLFAAFATRAAAVQPFR
jgi:hypothetical protein